MLAESVLPDYQARNWQPVGEDGDEPILFLVENEYVPMESRIDSHLTYVRAGQTQTRTAQHFVYTLAEIRGLFGEAGLTILDCYGSIDGESFALGDEAVWILAKR